MKPERFYKSSGFLSHTVAYQNIPILSDIFGRKPDVATWSNIILGDEQAQSLLSNIKNFGNIQALGNLWQNYMLGGLEHAVPGFGNMLKDMVGATEQEFGKAKDFLAGILPKDVIQNVYGSSAMQALLSGTLGAPLAAAGTARNLGLTSLDLINQGAGLLGRAGQGFGQLAGFGQQMTAPIAQMLLTPEQQYQSDLQNKLIQLQLQQERYNVAAAPNPIAKGLSDIVMYLTGKYLGSLGGGGMGGGAMGGGGGGGGGLPSAGNAPAEQAASGAQGVPIVPGGDVSAMSGFQGPGGTTFPSGINFATSGLGDTPVDTSGLGGSTWSTAGMWGNQTAGGDLALATGATTPGFAGPGGTNFTYGSDPFAAIAGVSPYGYGMGGSSWDATLGNIPDQFNFPSSQSLGTPNYPYLGGG